MTATTSPPTLGMRLDLAIESLNHLSSTQLYILIVASTIAISYAVLSYGPSSSPDDTVVAGVVEVLGKRPPKGAAAATTTKPIPTSNNAAHARAGPEPKWHIFKWVNVAVMLLFVYSVVDFGWHGTIYSTSSAPTLWKFLVGWSVLLCYFFGFFGVSLVHDTMEPAPAMGTITAAAAAATTTTNEPTNNSSEETRYVCCYAKLIAHSYVFCCLCLKQTISTCLTHETINPSICTYLSICCLYFKTLNRNNSSKPVSRRASSRKTVLPAAKSAPVCSDPESFHKGSSSTPSATTTTTNSNYSELSDEQIAQLVLCDTLKDHELEKRLDCVRAVAVRRLVVNAKLTQLGHAHALDKLPHQHALDYARVHGANCEIVVGYVPIPVGICGPLTLNNSTVFVPMATTEGCLVASTNRGCKAITQGGGATAVIVRDGITRAPCVRMPSAHQAAHLKLWVERPEHFAKLKTTFESTTSFGKLQQCRATVAGRNVYLRLQCFSGDAMGMNMGSKGSLAVIDCLKAEFPELTLVALSGNMCTDKKAAAINWLEGRGKSVVVEATIPKEIVQATLKTTVSAMVYTNLHKNLIGSAMAGSVGGFNAHASNIVTAIFLATGQDPAQNVESSNCITILEEDPDTGDLWASCTMPSIEVGTVGGGTSLEAQSACLQAVGCKGASANVPGENAQQLARIVAAATLAGELSLLAALAANTLVAAHMQHNRKPTTPAPLASS